MKTMKISATLTLLVLAAIGCGTQQSAQGPGSETIAYAGRAVYSSGDPVSGAIVTARKESYLSTLPDTVGALPSANTENQTTTDDDGYYTLTLQDTGIFLVEINDFQNHATLFTCTTTASQKSPRENQLSPTGTITGGVLAHNSDFPLYVRVYGLERIVDVDLSQGTFSIPNMPEGIFDLNISPASGESDIQSHLIPDQLVAPEEITYTGMIDMESGTRMDNTQKIVLNTSSNGAHISENVYNFPVLVRLDETNFDFSRAASDGSDILFTDANRAFLPHQIERFDADLQRAELWVLVDTVYAEDSTQTIYMHWGTHNGNAFVSKEVFDTTNGFQCVFHFSQSSFDTLYDATANDYFGLFGGDTFSGDCEGAIGRGFEFDGTSDFFTLPNTAEGLFNFADDASYTLSAWVYVDSLTDSNQYIITKGEYQYGLRVQDTLNWEMYHFRNTSEFNAVRATVNEKAWALLTGVYNKGHISLYVNNILVRDQFAIDQSIPNEIMHNVFLGKKAHGDSQLLDGKMDEVRICDVARSDSWIKLSYMNQKPVDILLQFQ